MLYPPSPLLSPATINRLLFILPLLILFPSFAFILVVSFSFSLPLIFFQVLLIICLLTLSSLPSCVHGLFHFISASPSLLSYFVR